MKITNKYIAYGMVSLGLCINANAQQMKENAMQISVEASGRKIIYNLNNSQAAKDLYAQLPLQVKVENYSTNEKVFYPQQKLNITDTPAASSSKGTLAYYAPWGNVVMFYGEFKAAPGLYALGEIVLNGEEIENLLGMAQISKVEMK